MRRHFFFCKFHRANDICRESKRQIISAEDVLKAVDEIEFPEFMDSLKIALEGCDYDYDYDSLDPYVTIHDYDCFLQNSEETMQ